MRAKTRQIVTGAAISGVGVAVTRALAPKLHERCRACCGPVPAQTAEKQEPLGGACCTGVRHAA
jgi:hypothetical protein